MSRQTLILGLGQFGTALARALAENGSEVIAVDVNKRRVDEIASHVNEAIVLDATDDEALASLLPASRDTCVCAIGDENRENSILVTALLKQLGARHIIARATDDLHMRILRLVGAHEVINPERNYGERLAVRLAWHNVVNVMSLGGGLVLTEVIAHESFLGRTLAELDLPRRFSVNVSAVRRSEHGLTHASIPDPHSPLQRGDILLVISTVDHARRFTERL